MEKKKKKKGRKKFYLLFCYYFLFCSSSLLFAFGWRQLCRSNNQKCSRSQTHTRLQFLLCSAKGIAGLKYCPCSLNAFLCCVSGLTTLVLLLYGPFSTCLFLEVAADSFMSCSAFVGENKLKISIGNSQIF